MSLQDWVRNGWASPHKSTRDEMQKLLSLADRDLASSATKGLATDWQFGIAHNAALQSATAATHGGRLPSQPRLTITASSSLWRSQSGPAES
jgi:hypothetical protein